MSDSPELKLKDAVTRVVRAAADCEIGTIRRITIDVGESSDVPFQIQVAEEQYPYVSITQAPGRVVSHATRTPPVAE